MCCMPYFFETIGCQLFKRGGASRAYPKGAWRAQGLVGVRRRQRRGNPGWHHRHPAELRKQRDLRQCDRKQLQEY